MKFLKYKFVIAEINRGTKEEPKIEQVLLEKSIGYSAKAEEIARAEAYNGEYEIYDDGQPDPSEQPTQLDRIEAQVAYNSMMLGTLMEV